MVHRKMDPELAGDPPPEAGDDVELVVLDVKAHDPGFYMNRTRTYFVAQDGSVYLVRAPGQPWPARKATSPTRRRPPPRPPNPGQARDTTSDDEPGPGAPCLLDADCGSDNFCELRICVAGCPDAAQCDADEVCDPHGRCISIKGDEEEEGPRTQVRRCSPIADRPRVRRDPGPHRPPQRRHRGADLPPRGREHRADAGHRVANARARRRGRAGRGRRPRRARARRSRAAGPDHHQRRRHPVVARSSTRCPRPATSAAP
jgi:hypothetical protein